MRGQHEGGLEGSREGHAEDAARKVLMGGDGAGTGGATQSGTQFLNEGLRQAREAAAGAELDDRRSTSGASGVHVQGPESADLPASGLRQPVGQSWAQISAEADVDGYMQDDSVGAPFDPATFTG